VDSKTVCIDVQPFQPQRVLALTFCSFLTFLSFHPTRTMVSKIKSGQSNLTGHMDAAHGRFKRIRQVAPTCTPSSTPQSAYAPYRCCPLLCRLEYIDRRTCLGVSCAGQFPPQNCPFARGSGLPSNTCFLGPTRVHIPNGLSNGSAVFLHSSLQSVPVRECPGPASPSKLPVRMARSEPPHL